MRSPVAPVDVCGHSKQSRQSVASLSFRDSGGRVLFLMKPYYQDESVTIYNADCRDVLPTLDTVDLVLTDPPYGIAENSGRRLHAYKDPEKSKGRIGWSNKAEVTDYGDTRWDNDPLDIHTWSLMQSLSENQVVWVANHLVEVLGKPKQTLVWDKKCKNGWEDTFSDFEVGYSSKVAPARMYRHLWMGAFRDGRDNNRVHPTQKPVELMVWCAEFFPDAQTILDPFMGSGTTLRAAKDLNRKAIGIEIEERYCEIAAKRMSQMAMAF